MLTALLAFAALFAVAGLMHAYGWSDASSLEAYITARGRIGPWGTIATLFASGMGSWILFGPPEAATWGGIPAIIGYSLGAAVPSLLYIPLGRRLRLLMPEGHALTEYVRVRYGRMMHGFILIIMLFYLFLALAAQVTGMGLIMQLVADVPLWITTAVVLIATVAYTAFGGLHASIFTDRVQAFVLLPLMAGGAVIAVAAIGDTTPLVEGVTDRNPGLLEWTFAPGVKGGLALVIGIAAASMFNQGTWQRVYAADTVASLRLSFATVAGILALVVAGTGVLGLAAVGAGTAEPASTALFGLLLETAPPGVGLGVVLLGLTLVMSSADTVLNAAASLVAVDVRPVLPEISATTLLRVARWATVGMAVPVFVVAAQGYSVLYLFLVADLVCAAALVPVFGGLFFRRLTGRAALLGTCAGLAVGGVLFPGPGSAQPHLLPAFVAALVVPAIVAMAVVVVSSETAFDLSSLRREVNTIE